MMYLWESRLFAGVCFSLSKVLAEASRVCPPVFFLVISNRADPISLPSELPTNSCPELLLLLVRCLHFHFSSRLRHIITKGSLSSSYTCSRNQCRKWTEEWFTVFTKTNSALLSVNTEVDNKLIKIVLLVDQEISYLRTDRYFSTKSLQVYSLGFLH